MQMTGNTIFITGGTSGIGRALAECFHKLGNKVLIAGRRQQLLDEITKAHPGMIGVQAELKDTQSRAALFARVLEVTPAVNVLINNAGISRPESLRAGTTDLVVSRNIIDTNIMSVLEMTALMLPILEHQENSTIITTTSGLAFVPRGNFPTYCASKAFLHSWVQSLRVQLKGRVDVLELVPPYVQTELSGLQQASDSSAMPLGVYVPEVMDLLSRSEMLGGEILVERVKGERYAERNHDYERRFALFNAQ